MRIRTSAAKAKTGHSGERHPMTPCSMYGVYNFTENTTSKSERSLYERLGGYDAIAAVADDLLPRFQADPQLGRFLGAPWL
jgi:hypothetical protein